MPIRRFCTAAIAALLASSWTLAEEACVIGADAEASRIPVGTVLAVAPHTDAVSVRCDAGSLSGLSIRLAAGASLEQRLLVDLPVEAIDSIAVEGDPHWLRIEKSAQTRAGTGFTLVIQAPANIEEGWQGTTAVSLDPASEQPGFQLPVKLLITAPAPLFRDGFGPDPIMGQFSFVN